MDSYLPKSYPSLMEGKKILYVHGFLSAGSTHTADVLRQFMPRATVLAPDLPVHPAEAMALLKETVESERPDLIIGTSMGGMYTEMLYGFDRICVNPAFEMGATMSEHQMMGKQTFQNPRQDGVQEIIVTKALVKEYREMTEHCFSQVTAEEQQRVFGLFGDEDPIVHTYDLFLQHYPQAIHFHGEHRLVEKAIYHYIIPIVRWIDDRQTGRNRPTVLIHWDTLADAYGQPKSSLHKAYEQLCRTSPHLPPRPTGIAAGLDRARLQCTRLESRHLRQQPAASLWRLPHLLVRNTRFHRYFPALRQRRAKDLGGHHCLLRPTGRTIGIRQTMLRR